MTLHAYPETDVDAQLRDRVPGLTPVRHVIPHMVVPAPRTRSRAGTPDPDAGVWTVDWWLGVDVDLAVDQSLWSHKAVTLGARHDHDGPITVHVGQFRGWVLRLDCDLPLNSAVARMPGAAGFRPLVTNRAEHKLTASVEAAFPDPGRHLLLLGSARLAPAWRGLGGVGRLLLMESLLTVAPQCRLAAVRPECRSQGPLLHQLGFTPWRRGTWLGGLSGSAQFRLAQSTLRSQFRWAPPRRAAARTA